MRSQPGRAFGALVGLVAVLGLASLAAAESLTDQQIGYQIGRQLSAVAFSNVTVSVQAHVVSLSGSVPSLWAKEAAIAKAGALSAVTSVVSEALEIERAESDRAIVEHIAHDIGRVSIPAPAAAARHGVSTPSGIAESSQSPRFPHRRSGFRGAHPGLGPGFDHRSGFGGAHRGFGSGFDHPHNVGRSHSGLDVGPNRRLQHELREALYGHTGNSFYGIFDAFDGWVDNGVVTLTGYVTHEYKASQVARLVSRVHGVREIHNQIEVLSTATLDNRLRFDLAKNIYGNPLFWNEALQNIPPIRIIVNNLHVTLAGIVNSEVDKRVAADIVRQTAGVITFRNNLEIRSSSRG